MLRSNKRVIGITTGDPAGIGPEITAKAIRSLPRLPGAELHVINEKAFGIVPGRSSKKSAQAALNALHEAIQLLKLKKINALVTAPLSKESICTLGIDFVGHTEYLADAFKCKKFAMMFVSPKLKTMIVTRHLPLKAVPKAINSKNILEAIELMDGALKKHFKIPRPVIAVCGLNPHAGEGGRLGTEEIKIIIPTIQTARKNGINVIGPLAADTLFSPDLPHKYDAVVAMYHDQGLIPVKTLDFSRVVNLTIGLPFIRTSPAHGTAFDIAGKNKANPASMIEAIKLAAQLIHTS